MKKLLTLFLLIFAVSCQQQSKTTSQVNNKNTETISKELSPRDEFLELLTEAKRLEALGRSVENLRKSSDEADLRQCGNVLSPNKQAAKELKERSQKLPPIYSTHLLSAAVDLELCITCSPTAIQRCDQAKKSIQEAETSNKN